MKPITAIISTGLALLACVLHFTPLSVWFTAATAFVALGFFGLYTRKLSLVTILGLILLFALSIVNTTRGQQDYFAPAAIVIAALSWRAVLTHRDALAVPVVQSAHLPQQATRIVRGTESSIAVAAIEPGMLLLLREGDVVPVDGLLTEGSCVVNEQALSGLARPIRKFPSSRVHAGSIVTEGRCILRVTEHGEHTLLERLRRRVENSILTPSVTAHRHAKLLRLLTPSLIIFAAVVGVAWAIWNVPAALIVTSAILLCASPSLFSLARDTRDSLRFLVQQGVLVQDAQTLEKLTHVDTVVFDKRGILTTGEVRVEHVVSYSPFTQQQVLNIAAAIESKSAHPISKVIVAFARSHGALSLQPVQEFHEEPGRGVRGLLGDKEVLAGSETFLRKRKIKQFGRNGISE